MSSLLTGYIFDHNNIRHGHGMTTEIFRNLNIEEHMTYFPCLKTGDSSPETWRLCFIGTAGEPSLTVPPQWMMPHPHIYGLYCISQLGKTQLFDVNSCIYIPIQDSMTAITCPATLL